MKRFALAAAVLGSAFLIAAGDPPAKEVGPLVELSGSFSKVQKRRAEVIGDEKRWESVWKEHMGDKLEKTAHGFDVIPYIDFSRCMVVAMFSGTSKNGAGWHVVSSQTRDGNTLIRYDQVGFQTASFSGEDKGVDTSAYGFATLERSSLPLILEENTQGLIGREPIWTERQRLPALPKPATAPGPRPVR